MRSSAGRWNCRLRFYGKRFARRKNPGDDLADRDVRSFRSFDSGKNAVGRRFNFYDSFVGFYF
jgi:hypothetical protein